MLEQASWRSNPGAEPGRGRHLPGLRHLQCDRHCKDTEKEYTAEPVQFLERRSGGWPPIVSREKVVAPIVNREKMVASYL